MANCWFLCIMFYPISIFYDVCVLLLRLSSCYYWGRECSHCIEPLGGYCKVLKQLQNGVPSTMLRPSFCTWVTGIS